MSDRDTPPVDLDTEILKAVEDSETPVAAPVSKPDPEPAISPAPAPAPAAPPPARSHAGTIMVSAIAGAALALAAGYAALKFGPPGLIPTAGLSELETSIAGEIAVLKADLASLASAPAPVAEPVAPDPALLDRIAALEAALAALPKPVEPDLGPLQARIAALESRLDAVAELPADGSAASPAAIAAQAQEIAQLQAELAALKQGDSTLSEQLQATAAEAKASLHAAVAGAEKLRSEAEAAAQAATAQAALSRLLAALDAGVPFESVLPALGSDLPEPLVASAKTGVPTMADLAATFPPAARTALNASLNATMGDSWTERVGTFLRTQTGIRSLTPQEGNDPDAVLSRAEAALSDGNLAAALAELAALPPEGQAAMQAWVSEANRRLAATDAVAAVAAALGQN